MERPVSAKVSTNATCHLHPRDPPDTELFQKEEKIFFNFFFFSFLFFKK